MSRSDTIQGLYIITTPMDGDADALVAATEAALRGGARVVQYRDKGDNQQRRQREAQALQAVTHEHGAAFIVNDDITLAAAVGADGIHLGRDDGNIRDARARLGSHALIGVSCYNELERGDWALAQGADYLAWGSAYPSPTKPDAPRAGPELLAQARQRFDVPLVSIGGITADNAGSLIAAGADAVAVISAVYAADDPESAAARLARACQPAAGSESQQQDLKP
jgi:thiamine-phosphate pyrophosphorylase